MQSISVYQNRQSNRVLQLVNLDGTPAANVFTASSVPTGNVWEGQNQPALFQPTLSWYTGITSSQTGYTQGQVLLSVASTQTAMLDPAGEYRLLVDVTTGGLVSPGWEGRFKVLATPGSTTPSPPDLATYDFIEAYLSEVVLTDAQRDFIPYMATAASQAIRLVCNDRYFDVRTLTETYDIALDGTVRLYQVPVLQITRVQGQPSLALTVQNTSTAVQTARAYFAFTGSPGGYGVNAQTATGLTLVSVSSGVATTTTVSYTANMTVSALATLINAVGGGWVATTNTTYGPWPATELTGGFVGQGCAIGAVPGDGATFNVLLDLTDARLDSPNRGFLWVGQQWGNTTAQRWGPGGYELFGQSGAQCQLGQAKVTYQAGFSTIPLEIQVLCAETVKWWLLLAKLDQTLGEEKAADYSYKITMKMLALLPDSIRQGLAPWKLHFA